MESIIKIFGENDDILLGCILTFLFGILAFRYQLRRPQRLKIYKDQLIKVYLPIFFKLEPNLYKDIDNRTKNEVIDFITNIITKNYLLFKSSTLDNFDAFKKHKNFETYISLCSNIDFNFEFLKWALKYPRRKFTYRLNHQQYHSKLISFVAHMLFISFFVFLLLLFFCVFIYIFFILINWIKNLQLIQINTLI